eukprot:g6356.t1
MALAMHRHGRCDEDDDVYASTDTSGIEVVSAGSVTSFVRKLFQMVQGECDSIVGFVADGTAFEVKDPRRLEQDILPKYFRHSRFQSLVRQLNFYSFKKISKERSVWIYKHAFFRRDEPELLHALKRKTNQHATPGPIGRMAMGGGGADGDGMMAGRSPVVDRSLPREAHDNKPRSRGPMFLPRHGGPATGSDFPAQHHDNHHQHHTSPPRFTSHPHQYHHTSDRTHPRPPHHPLSAPSKSGGGSGRMYHASSSRSTGGGPSTGGGAVPSYGGQGPSARGGSGTPGGWAGAGGRPVSSGSGQGSPGTQYERRNGSGRGMTHNQGYNQGPAMGDTGGERGALGQHSSDGGNRGPATGAAAVASDKEQALAIWGLTTLYQAASSATEAPLVDDEERGRTTGGSRRLPDDRGRQQQKRHRGAASGPASTAARGRRGWAVRDESSGDEEEDLTSAERDDSSSSVHRRSPSNSSSASSRSSVASSADSAHSNLGYERHQNTAPVADRGNNDMATTAGGARVVPQQQQQHQQQQQQRPSGSGGVFCPTWDWGRAAHEPAIRLPGSFVDRRFEEVDEQVEDVGEFDEDGEEESSKTEEEDMGEDQEEDEDEEDEQARKLDTTRAARAEKTAAPAEVSPSLAVTRSITSPVTTPRQQRDLKADMEAETKVGLEGIGALFNQFCSGEDGTVGGGRKLDTNASASDFLATVTNSGDSGLREMSVFCAGPAGRAPDEASPVSLVRHVSLFLQSEGAVAEDLRVYAEALDPAAVGVVVGRTKQSPQGEGEEEQEQPLSTDGAKLLRVFCRYAACRLGRALEVASCAAAAAEAETHPADDDEEKPAREVLLRQSAVAQRITPRLDECRWKWWRAAVRFS